MNLVRMLIFGVIIVSAFGFVVFQVLQFFFSIQVSSSRFKKDVDSLKEKLEEIKKTLITIDQETVRLLSFGKEENFIKDNISIYKEGLFTSIYHEPMLAYIFKQYITRRDKAILLVETKNDTYEYYISNQSTRVVKNDLPYGVIQSSGDLIDNEGNLLVTISLADKKMLPILKGEKHIAILNNPRTQSSALSRAFDLVDTDSSIEEEAIIVLSTLLAVQAE